MSVSPTQARWTVKDLLGWTTPFFEKRGAHSPRLDAELLLSEVLGCDRLHLYLEHDRPVDAAEREAFRALVKRRAAGEPVAYVLGRREFYGRTFRIDARVLVPRPETELLVDVVLEHLPGDAEGPLLDLCSGSGCIGVSLACERTNLKVVAGEISPEAAALGEENASLLGVAERYAQRVGDLYAVVDAKTRFAVITANPPYIASTEYDDLPIEVRQEPRGALLADDAGLAIAHQIIQGATDHLAPDGLLLIEHGETQGEALRERAREAGLTPTETRRDLAGHPRLLLARR